MHRQDGLTVSASNGLQPPRRTLSRTTQNERFWSPEWRGNAQCRGRSHGQTGTRIRHGWEAAQSKAGPKRDPLTGLGVSKRESVDGILCPPSSGKHGVPGFDYMSQPAGTGKKTHG